jgi:tetratricopeptide (TPR) repeat protein
MMRNYLSRTIALSSLLLLLTALNVQAQSGSTRPRRVKSRSTTTQTETKPATTGTASEPLLDVAPANSTPAPSRRRNNNAPATNPDEPLLTTTSSTPVSTTPAPSGTNAGTADTTHAFSLLQQKQYAAALKEAKRLAASNPNDSEAWKIAGFAELNLKQYEEAAADLQKALDLQRTARQEDPFTIDALGHAYFLSEKFDRALPLLVATTTRPNAKPEAVTVYYRGVAEYRTGKRADAERTFNAIIKDNPKDASALLFLGQIAYERNDLDGAIALLNRATLSDARSGPAWSLLTLSYLQRAGASAATAPEKSDADYLSAVRAGESLTRVRTDAEATMLFAQALIGAKQFARAATVLERAVAAPDAAASTFYLLGVAQSRAKNFPKAISALERAAAKTPDDTNIYRELGYAYEIQKQYAKALVAYEKGAALAPNEPDLKESAERVRPYAK